MIALSAKQWKIVGLCVAGLVLIGAVLFGIDRCGSWREQRKIDKIKANVNAALVNVANIEVKKRELELQQAAELEAAKRDVEEFNEAANASIEAREEVNKALENVNIARNSNTTGTTVDELKRKLDRLDR
jgi:hypothetical protein